MNKWTNERMDERIGRWVDGGMSEDGWMDGWMNEWLSEWMNERTNEQTGDWANR